MIRVNYGLQRHGGGGMAVRTIVCLPALSGDWRYPGAGALPSTSKAYEFDENTRRGQTYSCRNAYHQHGSACRSLARRTSWTPGAGAVRLQFQSGRSLPGPVARAFGSAREDLFTVVHDQFQTDTADFADIVLPATSQLEHFDIHSSYGHLYVQSNNPAIAPLGEAKPNTEVFRLLARAMGFEPELFEESDEEIARKSQRGPALRGVSLEATKAGPVRLNLPENWAPFATGRFPTPSGSANSIEREARAGRDPLPHYVPPHEDPQTKPELAAKFPLQLLTPPAAPFLNSTFVNVDALRRAAGERTLEIHPDDAARGDRQRPDGEHLQCSRSLPRKSGAIPIGETRRGRVARIALAEVLRRWRELQQTTSTATTDLGGGALSSTTLWRLSWSR